MQTRYSYYELGFQEKGNVVEVTLIGNAANVRLLDSLNFQNYSSGKGHQYYGGLILQSPVELVIPRSDFWFITIDMNGLAGETNSSVRMISKEAFLPLPEYRPYSGSSSTQTMSNYRSDQDDSYYDVFISHATEDKNEIVRPLAKALVNEGLRVWYDEFELQIGDSLRGKIDGGLARAHFGIVVLSPSFFAKNWTRYELDGLITREMSGSRIILPLWHRITKNEIIAKSPSLADKIALSTSDLTAKEIAYQIAKKIRHSR